MQNVFAVFPLKSYFSLLDTTVMAVSSHVLRFFPLFLMINLHFCCVASCPQAFKCGNSSIDFPFTVTDDLDCGINIISCSGAELQIAYFNHNLSVKRIDYQKHRIEICCPDSQNKNSCADPSNFSTLPDQLRLSNFQFLGPLVPCGGKACPSSNQGFALQWSFDCYGCETSEGSCSLHGPSCRCKNGSVQPIKCKGKKDLIKLIVGIGVASASATVLIYLLLFVMFRKCVSRRLSSRIDLSSTASWDSSVTLIQFNGGLKIFSYEELEKATDGFNTSKELGDGGFGIVYYGRLRDGRQVAVKRLYEHNCNRVQQFMNETEILSKIRHPNLVRLYGCTTRHSRELLLVYEFISNGTVSDHLHGSRAAEGCLTWKVRITIAIETAEALAYLHQLEPPIIHRDVKSNNILLDSNFSAKLADLGLSRLFPFDASHVSTVPLGTPGYIDPQYHECYRLTDKSDVYSFGVVLIELISSLQAIDFSRHKSEINLAHMAISKIHNNSLHELVDDSIGFQTDDLVQQSVNAVGELAFRCLAEEWEVRPAMDEVAEALRKIKAQMCKSEKKSSFEDLPS